MEAETDNQKDFKLFENRRCGLPTNFNDANTLSHISRFFGLFRLTVCVGDAFEA